MTVIAYDGTIVAADGLGTTGNLRDQTSNKKVFILGHAVYAFCGPVRLLPPMLHWVHDNKGTPETWPNFREADTDDGCALLKFRRPGECYLYQGFTPYCETQPERWAWGQGREIAIGAMAAGANALDAVQITCKFNVWTGAKLSAIDLNSWKHIHDTIG